MICFQLIYVLHVEFLLKKIVLTSVENTVNGTGVKKNDCMFV